MDRSGRRLGEFPKRDQFSNFDLAPAGDRISVTVRLRPLSLGSQLWLLDVLRGVATIEGGTRVEIGTSSWGGGSWGPDDRIVYPRSYQEGLWEVDGSGGTETMLTAPDAARGELAHWWPQILPDGDHILFTAYRAGGETTIEVFSRSTKARKELVKGGVFGRYVPSGHLVYAKAEALFAVRFDLASLTTMGGAVPILADVAQAHGDGYAVYDVSPDGTMVYLPVSSFDDRRELVFVSRDGVATLALPEPDYYNHPALSPDGTRIALDVKAKGGGPDVWVFPVGSRSGTRITDNPGRDFAPVWTPRDHEAPPTRLRRGWPGRCERPRASPACGLRSRARTVVSHVSPSPIRMWC